MGRAASQLPLVFQSADKQFGLQLESKFVRRILWFCKRAGNAETGGIFVGTYNAEHDMASVTNLSGPPADSQSTTYTFYRGVAGLQEWIDKHWRSEKHHYLGEWHYHPYSDPTPSPTDVRQLKDIASSPSYHCPEPILLILGGDPHSTWITRVYVFPKKGKRRELFLIMQPTT